MLKMRDNTLLDARLDALGISQNELARRADISKASMSAYRSCNRRVEHDVAERIAGILDVPVHAMFETALPPRRQTPPAATARIYPRSLHGARKKTAIKESA